MNLRRAVWAVMLLALACGAIPVVGQGEPLAYLAAQTAQGVTFYAVMPDHALRPVGMLPPRFGLEDGTASADCRILGQRSFAISPDRQRIAFTAECGAAAKLVLVSLGEGGLAEYAIPSYWLLPDWSPTSEAILLSPPLPYWGSMPAPESYVFDALAETLAQLTVDRDMLERYVAWTPVGDAISYLGLCELDSDCAGRGGWSDVYLRGPDGLDRALIAIVPQIGGSSTAACNLVWSPFDGRLYFEVGCTDGRSKVFSVGRTGDARLEVDLEVYLRSTDGEALALYSVDVSSIHPRPEGIYLSGQVRFGPDPMSDIVLTQWRVLLVKEGQVETLYEQLTPGFEQGQSAELDGSVLSPDGQKMVMLFNGGDALVVDLIGGENRMLIPDEGAICRPAWLDLDTLIYESGGPCTDDARRSYSINVRLFDVTTGAVTNLTDSIHGVTWRLSSHEGQQD